MSIKTTTFNEPIYTRRTSFNHVYDVTLNEITKDSKNNAFSDLGYAVSLLKRLENYGTHEKTMFLEYQLNRSAKPLRWLLDFERLLELNNWKSGFEFINCRTDELNILIGLANGLFKNIDNGKFQAKAKPKSDNQNNDEVIFNSTESCSYLNISKSTLYKLTSSKSIAFYKPNGKNMYFKKDELDAYLTSKRELSNSELETQTNDYISRNWKP